MVQHSTWILHYKNIFVRKDRLLIISGGYSVHQDLIMGISLTIRESFNNLKCGVALVSPRFFFQATELVQISRELVGESDRLSETFESPAEEGT